MVQQALDDLARLRATSVRAPAAASNRPPAAEEEVSPQAAQAAAARYRCGSIRAARATLVGGLPVPPGPDADAAVQSLFRTEPLVAEEKARLEKALAAAAGLPERRRLRVTNRMVGRQAAAIAAAAGPGPSGHRSSYIQCLYAHLDGPACLRRWCQVWAAGAISPWLAELWTGALARPFWKDDRQASVRPILCGEALYKFALAVCVTGSAPQVAEAVGPWQY